MLKKPDTSQGGSGFAPPVSARSIPNQCSGWLLEQEARAAAQWLGIDFAKIVHPQYLSEPLIEEIDKLSLVSTARLRWVMTSSFPKRLAVAPADGAGTATKAFGTLYALPLRFWPASGFVKAFPRAKLPDGFVGTAGYALLIPALRLLTFTEGVVVTDVAGTVRLSLSNGCPVADRPARLVIAELHRRKLAPLTVTRPIVSLPPLPAKAPPAKRPRFSHLMPHNGGLQ